MTNSHAHPQAPLPMRTGPVGRLVRLIYAAVLAAAVYGLLQTGMSSFSDPEILRRPLFWLITIGVIQGVYDLPAHLVGPSWGRHIQTGFLALAAVAAIVAVLAAGRPWAAPLTGCCTRSNWWS
jgi:hypothetical protein